MTPLQRHWKEEVGKKGGSEGVEPMSYSGGWNCNEEELHPCE